jgi:hypothetical protein
MLVSDFKNYTLNINSVSYVVNHLLRVANYHETKYHEIFIDNKSQVIVSFDSFRITFRNLQHYSISEILDKNVSFKSIKTFDDCYDIPVVNPDSLPFYEINYKEIIINHDIITISFLLLSRLEEHVFTERDNYGRFKFVDSISYSYNIIDIPLVDEYAMLLKQGLDFFLKKEKKIRKSNIILTQDVDFIFRFSSLFKSFISLLGELYFKRNLKSFFISFRSFIKTINNPLRDPYFNGVKYLLNLGINHGLESRIYFMTYYLKNKSVRFDKILREIRCFVNEKKITIGIHPDLGSFKKNQLFNDEYRIFNFFFNTQAKYNRQHFLQIDVRYSFDLFETEGIDIDSTLYYAEHEGFRCGTSHHFNPFNFDLDKPYNFLEEPIIVMDGTLRYYRKLSEPESKNVLIELFKKIKRVGGNFVILWHNDTVSRDTKYTKNVLEAFLKIENK